MPITLRIEAAAPTKALDDTKKGLVEAKGLAREVGVELTKTFGSPVLKNGAVSITDFAKSVSGASTVQEQWNQKVQRAANYIERMRNTVSPLEKNMQALTRQLQHEADLLQRINGPMDEFQKDMAALDALHRRGAISAKTYASELERVGRAAGVKGANPMDAVSLPGGSMGMKAPSTAGQSALSAMGSQLMSIAGPAALAAAAIGSITEEMERWAEHDRTIMNATNQLLRFYDTAEQARGAVAAHVKESQLLGVTVHEQIEAYDAVGDATEDLAKSQGQLMDITRNLSMNMIHEGKSIGDVARVMDLLHLGMTKGSLESRELRSIVKEFPEVAQGFASSIGKSREEMLKMAQNGQLTRREINAFISSLEDGRGISAKFAERQLDIKQVMDQQHVSFTEAMQIVIDHKKAVEEATRALDPYEEKLRGINNTLSGVIVTMSDFDDKLDRATLKYWTDSFDAQHQKNLKAVTDGVKAHNEAVQKYKSIVDSILGPQKEWEQRLSIINNLFDTGRISVEKYTKAMRDLAASSEDAKSKVLGIVMSGATAKPAFDSELTGNAAWEKGHEGFSFDMGFEDSPSDLNQDIAAQMEKEKALWKMREDYTKAWIAEMERAQKANEQLTTEIADGFATVGESIVQMSLDGKSSVNDMVRKIAADIMQLLMSKTIKAFLNMVTGGSPTGIGGGMLPGFASGGMIKPGGSGGTDSQVIAFRKSPDETVRVTTPAQEGALRAALAGAGGPGATHIHNHNHLDGDSIVGTYLQSPSGERLLANFITRHAPALRGRTDGR